jgi:glutamate--cysteine ligase
LTPSPKDSHSVNPAVLDDLANNIPLRSSLSLIQRGIEKESLRIQGSGHLALSAHPKALGSALTHPEITTDYSEALLEFITPTYHSPEAALAHLDDIQRFTYPALGDELLWTASMPCVLSTDNEIPVAQYGSSNIGKMKTVYRLGLGHRYGRPMQTIAGIHYNFSLPDSFWQQYQKLTTNSQATNLSLQDFKTEQYLGMIRNFRRYVWLLIYLFGASPAVCGSFVKGRTHSLSPLTEGTLHAPFGTALRMGDLGYQSSAQESLFVSYNTLSEYIESLLGALTQTHPQYQKIGLSKDGEYQQLSDCLLQIENEFYSTVRPKRTTKSGEIPLKALEERGIEYIEVRCIDLNPYLALGADAEQLRFIDTFLLFCLFADSPSLDQDEHLITMDNMRKVVMEGRKPGLELNREGSPISMQEWGAQLLAEMQVMTEMLDSTNQQNNYRSALKQQQEKLKDSSLTPSALILQDLSEQNTPYFRFALKQAQIHRDAYLQTPLTAEQQSAYEQKALDSLAKQTVLDKEEEIDFGSYLASYFEQYKHIGTRQD